MPKLRRLSGAELVQILGRFGFAVHAIFVQAARFVPEPELRRHFYTD